MRLLRHLLDAADAVVHGGFRQGRRRAIHRADGRGERHQRGRRIQLLEAARHGILAADGADTQVHLRHQRAQHGGGGARAGNLVADIFDAYYAMKDGSLTLDETGAGETADTTADGQDAVPETVENNDALADDTAPAEQPAA